MLSISSFSNLGRHFPRHMTISKGNFDRAFKSSSELATIYDKMRCAIYMTYTHLSSPFVHIQSGFQDRTKPNIITALIINFVNKLANEFRFPNDITTALSKLVLHYYKSSNLYETGNSRYERTRGNCNLGFHSDKIKRCSFT